MENSADALRIASGVLIAVLLLSMLVYVFRNISGLENTKKNLEVQEQISQFNKKFLAFDKTSMYGTDVISIIGLAISNNKLQAQSKTANPIGTYDPDLDYSINIQVKIKNTINKKTTMTLYRIEQKDGISQTVLVPQNEVLTLAKYGTYKGTTMNTNPYVIQEPLLNAGTYSLKDPDQKTYETLEGISANSEAKVKSKTLDRGNNYTLVIEEDNYGLNDFKKVIYKCTKVKNDGSGRVNYMEFMPKE